MGQQAAGEPWPIESPPGLERSPAARDHGRHLGSWETCTEIVAALRGQWKDAARRPRTYTITEAGGRPGVANVLTENYVRRRSRYGPVITVREDPRHGRCAIFWSDSFFLDLGLACERAPVRWIPLDSTKHKIFAWHRICAPDDLPPASAPQPPEPAQVPVPRRLLERERRQ